MISISTSQTSHISSSPAYGIFICQFIRYARACSSYECFIPRARRHSSKLVKQGSIVKRLKSSFTKFYGRCGDHIQQYEVSLSSLQWLPNRSDFPQFHDPDTELDLHRITSGFHGAFAMGVACQQGTLTLPDTWLRHPFGDLLTCSNCWDQFSRTCRVFSWLFTLNTPL